MAVSEKWDNGVFGRKAKQMQCVTNYRISTKDRHIHTQDHQDAIREEGLCLARQDTVLFILCELFTLTITSISFMKTRLIRTAINTADTNAILKQSVIIVIRLSKFSLIYLL